MALKRSRAAYEADLQRQQSPYVFFGTALPPLDPHTRDDGSYVPVWKQEVVDERGRKRLHGAFTGGFSAGYFNSVGSKEGWTPASFVSSRANRAKPAQRAEDYMDDEDLADAEEAKQLETKAAYSGFGSTEQELAQKGPFMDLFRPQDETMGLKLLRRMGWRDGQGIGPHVRRRRKKTGPNEPGGDEEEEYLAAPENTRLISFVRKLDTKGLGYGVSPGQAGRKVAITRDLSSEDSPITFKKPTKPKRGGMGIGILNDTGSDDEDPYDMGPKLSLPRALNGEKKKKKKSAEETRAAVNSNPLLKNKPIFVSKKASGFRKCHDGKLPLDGFVLSTQGPISEDRSYPAPIIPEGWKPALQRSTEDRDASNYQSTADIAKASTFDPSSRASLLGETPLPGKSVFDFLTPSARDKLVSASNNPNLPAARSEALPSTTQSKTSTTLSSQIPELDPQIAATALGRGTSGFVPYTDDPPKLARYRAFLTYRSGLDKNAAAPECPAGTRREDFINELHEFAHSATIFKPMTGAMASRFTSSTGGGPSSSGTPGQSTGTGDGGNGEDRPVLALGGDRSLPPEEEAAKQGMWGPLTRKTESFFPTRLLCKRFGVPPPVHVMPDDAGTGVTSGSKGPAARSVTDMLAGFGSRFTSGGVQVAESEQQGRKDKLEILGKRDMDELRRASGLPALGEVVKRKERAVVDPNVNEALEAERPSEETFKAIFADD